MTRFLVVELATMAVDTDGTDEGTEFLADAAAVVPCEDTRAVHRAVRAAEKADHNWSVWERSSGGYARRAVIYKYDGLTSYDVEIQ